MVHVYRLYESFLDLRRIFWGARFSSLESACNINNCQCMFEDFPRPSGRFVMRKEKKIILMNSIWRFNIKSWSRDMLWSRQINLPDGLPHQPKLWIIFWHSSFFSQPLHSCQALPKAFRARVDSLKFPLHFIIVYKKRFAAIPKPFLRRRLSHLAFVEHLACKSRKALVLSEQALDYAPCCTASEYNLCPPKSVLPAPWFSY